jgi:hypothetical protein
MAIPNCKHIVERLKAQFPEEWSTAHFGGPHTEDFIKRLAWVLHTEVDSKFGLLGQRGNPNVLADDAILFRGEGPGHDPTNGNEPVSGFDVIGQAGSASASPEWNFINQAGEAAWVQPRPVSGVPVPEPGPGPTPQPAPCDLGPVLQAIANLSGRLDSIEGKAGAAAHEAFQAASRASEIKTQIENLPAGQPAPLYVGRVPKAFGGSAEVTFVPRQP